MAPDACRSRLLDEERPRKQAALLRRSILEGVGTALFMAVAIAAVILPERLWAVDALHIHAVSVCCAVSLFALTFASPVLGGALFNPVLSLGAVLRGHLSRADCMAHTSAQIAGAIVGVTAAQAAFNLDAVQEPVVGPVSFGGTMAEFFAACLFVGVAYILEDKRKSRLTRAAAAGLTFLVLNEVTPFASFANPAVTIARTLTSNTLALSMATATIAVAAQFIGGSAVILTFLRRA